MAGHDVQYGKHRTRRSFSRIKEVIGLPNLIEVQTSSYQNFLDTGLADVFKEMFPIDNFSGTMELEFVGYEMKTPKYTVEEARAHDANFSAPIYVTFRLVNKETGELKTQEVFFGDFPLMTEMGTFINNGSERLIVSQLVRSPGSYFHLKTDKNGIESYGHTTIPNRGAWFELDTDAKGVGYVRIDRTRKLTFTTMVRALGFGSDEDIRELFGESELLETTLSKDVHKNPSDTRTEEALKDIYDRLRPGEPKTADSSRGLLVARFFDPKRYDFAPVGRYKFNKKLALKNRLLNLTLAEPIVDEETGEILVESETLVTRDVLNIIEPLLDNGYGMTVYHPSEDGVMLGDAIEVQTLKVYSPKNPDRVVTLMSNGQVAPEDRVLKPADVLANINYWLGLFEGIGKVDDIDHLGNRRIRSVGELLQNQVRIGLSRMERVIRERMSSSENENITPQGLINIRPVTASIKEFFGSSQLSQFMDQHNPLSELSHKRRFSALGPGGISRDRASYEVRDVHYTHYGRMCPIETPEGPNIGLINNLSTYAKINEYGFIMSPFRRIDRATGLVTADVEYLTADEEDNYTVAQANSPLTDDNHFANDTVMARHAGANIEIEAGTVDYMDVSPKQVVATAAACIPFLENDDSNRALMGANMQRQAVPLIDPHSPLVGTGMEYQIAHDSGAASIAKYDGTCEYVDGNEVRIRRSTGELDIYNVTKYQRSNSGTSYNQRPLVKLGDKVEKGDVVINGPSMADGELALGNNPLIAYMTWEGYNFEDAVIMSERMVKDDVYTSIAIEEYESETRDTKLGPEEITREIPNVGDDAIKNLDEDGIIRIGAEVADGDILVGKVTPKGETDPTPEERLLRAIFGEKAREVRDTSLRVPHGGGGIVHQVHVFTRENGDELPSGVNTLVRVFIAQKRKIRVGDKMSGRHGNKGVVSNIVPVEDMPYLPDGTPIDIMLNPLGVPSRMNIGQVKELHLGMAARILGIQNREAGKDEDFYVATPVFDGASDEEIWDTVKEAGMAADAKTVLYDGRTGEPFDNRISVGVMYMIKLHHMVDDKLHARSVGPYSLVTQQPLGGKAQFGGQRFGEMEVWALEAYGASNVLQEILTYKSDDVIGRTRAYEAIVKGERIPRPGLPESFRVLVKELQSLGLDMKVLDADHNTIDLRELDDDMDNRQPEPEITAEMLEAQEAILDEAKQVEQTLIDTNKID
ncbi:DNA-directed RNA polymerase subunit beta [Lactococcus hircilactis]|uniref:DNA-directed RNA polymerase subunit beta n=3 Tax=Bacilli TaxID=91061 RepID=A0A7X1Z7N6_9LACT|nr:DNA-directed RNA polymerase subunit beta [Lactococcus hircilactis]MQW39311.1 DNA-directed RNA polymerase subunit beta [Lactococcus hircilactis]